jgi:hypothetical protein
VIARPPRIPSYRLHRASGQGVATFNGRDVNLGRHADPASRAAHDRMLAEWLANGHETPSDTPLTIAQLIVRYIHHIDERYQSNEPANIRHALRPFRVLYGTALVTEFGPMSLKTVRQSFVDAKICRNEINKRTRRIVRLFKWGVAEELVPATVHQALKTVEGLKRGSVAVRESKPVKPVRDQFVDAIQPFTSRQVWAMIQLQRLTGARPGEVCCMRTCDLNTKGEIWEYTPERHKTQNHGKARTIYIGGPRKRSYDHGYEPSLNATCSRPWKPSRNAEKSNDGCGSRRSSRVKLSGSGDFPSSSQATTTRRARISRRSDTLSSGLTGIGSSGMSPRSRRGIPTSFAITSGPRFEGSMGWTSPECFWGTRRPSSPRSMPNSTKRKRSMRCRARAECLSALFLIWLYNRKSF